MTDEFSIQVENIHKDYRLYQRNIDRVKETLHPFRKKYHQLFRALNGVSFKVKTGEAFGIIGRNGGGKSTLLQIICGIIEPTRGKVTVKGRMAALLELGAGFNPEFTGRENIFINAAILGLNKKDIENRLDSIVEFADIGEFIDQKVKFYSSGMFMRLAFAVSTSVNADILLIDEALAVGDFFFRQKCYQRLNQLREKGVTVLLVTHAMQEVQQFCERAVFLDRGNVIFYGSAAEAVDHYYLKNQGRTIRSYGKKSEQQNVEKKHSNQGFWPNRKDMVDISGIRQVSDGWANCTGLAICDLEGKPASTFQQGETILIFYEFYLEKDIDVPIGGVVLQNDRGLIVHGKHTLQYEDTDPPHYVSKGSNVRFRQEIELNLACGEYAIEIGFSTIESNYFDHRGEMRNDELDTKIERLCYLPYAFQFAVLPRNTFQPVQLLHHGVADLPGSCEISMIQ